MCTNSSEWRDAMQNCLNEGGRPLTHEEIRTANVLQKIDFPVWTADYAVVSDETNDTSNAITMTTIIIIILLIITITTAATLVISIDFITIIISIIVLTSLFSSLCICYVLFILENYLVYFFFFVDFVFMFKIYMSETNAQLVDHLIINICGKTLNVLTLKVALEMFGRKFYENTKKIVRMLPNPFNFHSLNPSSRKPSDNRRN